ncbi:glycosyltransferase [Gracilibacillus suaedae]|uniref:glycosyltransferase n=1 Tax=Gracilibacillus suaedae TaxID=2820273 RepID=UPI001ABE4719|nr:glycosyltransferase [Gracilibacillus suaedae]
MSKYKDILIIIPAYNPDNELIGFTNELISKGFNNILVINDGSKKECNNIFDHIEQMKECEILQHAINLGKGRGLKNAFNHVLSNYQDIHGVITVDADGQHAPDDIKKVADRLLNTEKKIILGSRDFSEKDIPFRSRFGNKLTSKVLYLATGMKISDTQTGLRGIHISTLPSLLDIKGERYEYEMNMILEARKYGIEIEEVTIQTIYLNENESSHFNPIIDSFKIYTIFIKYAISSLSSFGIDILLFALLSVLLKEAFPNSFIFYATIGARVLSSLFNYVVNKTFVFQNTSKRTLYKYYTLSVTQMLVSSYGVYLIYTLIGSGEVVIKIFVDTILFLMSYYIQRVWVFKSA